MSVAERLKAEAEQALLKIYSFPELRTCWGVTMTRPRLNEAIREEAFPAPVRLGPNRVGWPGERLLAWRQALTEQAYQPKPDRNAKQAKPTKSKRQAQAVAA
jgi:predicted DNA-binding transcriptional regulator AlpA